MGTAEKLFPPPSPAFPLKRRLVLQEPGEEMEIGEGVFSGIESIRVEKPAPSGEPEKKEESEEFRAEASAVWAEFGRRERRLCEREAELLERERAISEAEALLRAQRKLATGRRREMLFSEQEAYLEKMEDLTRREVHMAECEQALEKKFLELSEREARLEQSEDESDAK